MQPTVGADEAPTVRVLVVDHDPDFRAAVEASFAANRRSRDWVLVGAADSQAALAALDEAPFDVVVVNSWLPGEAGTVLLGRVRDLHRDTVRIILSERDDRDAGLRALNVAHQSLRKPCHPDLLRETVARAANLRLLLVQPALREIAANLGTLPASPRRYGEVSAMLADPEVSIQSLARVMEQDVAMTARCLQIVNSAFFGLRRRITVVREALVYIGLDTLRAIVYATDTFNTLAPGRRLAGFDLAAFEGHAGVTATIVGNILKGSPLVGDGRMAGMLHDVGKLLLATRLTDRYAAVLRQAQRRQTPLHQLEADAFGVTHAEVGAYLLGIWGLPLDIVEAVAYHHQPGHAPGEPPLLPALHVANVLARERDRAETTHSQLDIPYLQGHGLLEHLPEWRSAGESSR